ncbi:response regulator transcription factor [Paenibacillus hamazuiensis]|uniref:response regulator transcription factor n=1 Tax=Paenibacillus hamazuiensis TaxID=2936508 RepID=UPI00200F2EBD|nr:response regulator [Paenibacillus hamazuiensis]
MKKVLVVDDEPMIRKGLIHMLERYESGGIRAFGAANGEEAIDFIRAESPDLVMTDIRMPKLDGLELCRYISEHHGRSIQSIVISGLGEFSYAQKCLSYGVREYLLKPVTASDLYPVLDKLLKPAKAAAVAAVSISQYEEWIERLEAAVWSVDTEEIAKLLEKGERDYFGKGMSAARMAQIVSDGLTMLVKRLNARSVYSFPEPDRRRDVSSAEQAATLLKEEVFRLCDMLLFWRGGNQKNVWEVAKAFIDEHITEDISLEAVADKVGLAPTYFSHLFKKTANETFVQYRIKKRMEMAKRLLELPHYKVVDVSLEVGYQSYPHFSVLFKKVIGCSPTDYRNSLGIK